MEILKGHIENRSDNAPCYPAELQKQKAKEMVIKKAEKDSEVKDSESLPDARKDDLVSLVVVAVVVVVVMVVVVVVVVVVTRPINQRFDFAAKEHLWLNDQRPEYPLHLIQFNPHCDDPFKRETLLKTLRDAIAMPNRSRNEPSGILVEYIGYPRSRERLMRTTRELLLRNIVESAFSKSRTYRRVLELSTRPRRSRHINQTVAINGSFMIVGFLG
eukprot:gene12443-14700_t